MTQRTCDVDGCENPYRSRGLCSTHYNQRHQPERHKKFKRSCETCGTEHESSRPSGRFCSLTCRDIWRIESGINPEPPRTVCKLPNDHPVRVMIREQQLQRDQRTPLRRALEEGDWQQVMAELESQAVKVDDCWLWSKKVKSGYGRIRIGQREYGVHRLAAAAALGEEIPSHMPVHHKCAESLCFNPDHLQVVTPEQNTAEMLERNHYLSRIRELEAALFAIEPTHQLLVSPPR